MKLKSFGEQMKEVYSEYYWTYMCADGEMTDDLICIHQRYPIKTFIVTKTQLSLCDDLIEVFEIMR